MRQVMMAMVALLVCLAQVAVAHDADSPVKPARKKVAVVLSGGGAKGTAHVGALKVLERAGIPIDIITGTSMGGIVGGIYACGHRADELDSIIKSQNWAFVLSDREDLRHQSLREREKQNTYVISKSLTFGKASQPPGGIILGKNISALFDALTAPYLDSIDFNRLPIPFACVATDVVDNTEQVFHSGVLSRAMRASMAIPGVFAPVKMGDKVLVDGGLRNNYPADVARAMGADYIIGVDVSSELKSAAELNSMSSILLQIIDHNCKDKFAENEAITDIMIRVNTKGYSSASFSSAAIDTLIRRGEEAAAAHWDDLVALRQSLGITEPAAPQVTHRPVRTDTRYQIGELRFLGMSKSDETYIRTKFRLKVGDSISMERADIIATAIRQDLYYKTATFRILNHPDRQSATVSFMAGQRRGNQINLGARFDSEEMVALQLNAELPIRSKVPMDVELTMRLGKRVMARADWSLHPISFFRPTISYVFRSNDIDFYDMGEKAYSLTYSHHCVKLSLFNFNVRNFNISLGANYDYYHYRTLLTAQQPEYANDAAALKDKGYLSYEAKAWYNSENHWYFPTVGGRIHARFAYYTDDFVRLDGKVGIRDYSMIARMNIPLSPRLTVQPTVYGRALYSDDVPFVLSNMVGGEWYGHYVDQQMPFAGVGNVELAWNKVVAAQLQAQYKLTTNNIVLLRFAAGQDAPRMEDLLKHKTILGGSLSYYYNSMFGPVGGSVGYNNLTRSFYYYINLGFIF